MEFPTRTPQDDEIDKLQFLETPKNWALQRPRLAKESLSRTPSRASSSSFQELLALRQAYRIAFEEALSRNRAMVEAIELAAEQVQDIRVTLLEEGPEVEISNVVFSMIVGFALDSNLVGRMAAAIVGAVLKPLKPAIRASIRAGMFPKEIKVRAAWENEWLKAGIDIRATSHAGGSAIQDIMLEELKSQRTQWSKEVAAKLVSDLTGSTFKDSVIAAGKAVQTQTEKYNKPSEKQAVNPSAEVSFGLDSPGVAFRRLGYNYLASLQHIYSEGMAYINDGIELATFDPESSVTILESLKAQEFITELGHIFQNFQITLPESPDQGTTKPIDPTREDIRQIFSLEFEKAIWCLMYGDKVDVGVDISTIVPTGDVPFTIENIDSRLSNYWMMRFLDPQTGKAFENLKRLVENMVAVYKCLNEIKRIVQKGQVKAEPLLVKFVTTHP